MIFIIAIIILIIILTIIWIKVLPKYEYYDPNLGKAQYYEPYILYDKFKFAIFDYQPTFQRYVKYPPTTNKEQKCIIFKCPQGYDNKTVCWSCYKDINYANQYWYLYNKAD